MQTYLEQEAIKKRDELEIYNEETLFSKANEKGYVDGRNEYLPGHQDTISDGDRRGKGTNSGGHQFFLPDHTLGKNTINYSNFNTTQGGGSYDVDARNEQQVREMYTKEKPYSADMIDMSANVGQYDTSLV